MTNRIAVLIALFLTFSTMGCSDTTDSQKNTMSAQEKKVRKHRKESQAIDKNVETAKNFLKKEKDDDSACQTIGKRLGNPIQRVLREDIERQYGNYILASELGLMTNFSNDTLNNKLYPKLKEQIDRTLNAGTLSEEDQKDISTAMMVVLKQGTKSITTEMIKKSLNKMESNHLEALKKQCICPQCDFSVKNHPHVKKFFKQDNGIYQDLCEKLQHNVEWYCKQRRKRNCAYEMDQKICFLWAPSMIDSLKDGIKNIIK